MELKIRMDTFPACGIVVWSCPEDRHHDGVEKTDKDDEHVEMPPELDEEAREEEVHDLARVFDVGHYVLGPIHELSKFVTGR
jgi:hypothetical protein